MSLMCNRLSFKALFEFPSLNSVCHVCGAHFSEILCMLALLHVQGPLAWYAGCIYGIGSENMWKTIVSQEYALIWTMTRFYFILEWKIFHGVWLHCTPWTNRVLQCHILCHEIYIFTSNNTDSTVSLPQRLITANSYAAFIKAQSC